jgi:hypothetical protein
MGKGVSGCADLAALAEKFLEDRQWHRMSEVVMVVGPQIPPERATWFFQAMRPERTPGKCDMMQKVREGTRRGIYLSLRQLIGRGLVECRETTDPSLPQKPDNREYRMVMSSEELAKAKAEKKQLSRDKAPKPTKEAPKQPTAKRQRKRTTMSTTIALPDQTRYPKDAFKNAMAFLEDVDVIRELFSEQFPNAEDKEDLEFHLRHVKRIITINFLSKPKVMEPEITPTEPTEPTEITTAIVKG